LKQPSFSDVQQKTPMNQDCVVFVQRAVILGLAVALCSCSKDAPLPEPVSSITGEVYVDGNPAESVSVNCLPRIDEKGQRGASTLTAADGTFRFTSFENGDGLPEADYVLTFFWGTMNLNAMRYEGPDKLKGRYGDPKASQFQVTVQHGSNIDLGRIELTTN
jgi:hypothetical protein